MGRVEVGGIISVHTTVDGRRVTVEKWRKASDTELEKIPKSMW